MPSKCNTKEKQVANTALIAISTPLGKNNFYSVFTDLKDANGDEIFNTVRMNMSCEMCDAIQQDKTKRAKACKHVLNRLPPWKDPEAHETVKTIFEQSGREGDYNRESRAVIEEDGGAPFQSEWIDALSDRPFFSANISPKWIITTCDPNGGGAYSDTAIMSAYYHGGKMVICGADCYPTRAEDKKTFIKAHIMGLRAVPRFRKSWIIFIPENNLDDAAGVLVRSLKRFERVHLFSDLNKDGVRTQTGSKAAYTNKTIEYMSGLEGKEVVIDEEIVISNVHVPIRDRFLKFKLEFIKQLRQWKRLVQLGKTEKTRTYVSYGGKSNDTGQLVVGQKDDLVITFIMNCYFSAVVQKDRSRFPKEIYL